MVIPSHGSRDCIVMRRYASLFPSAQRADTSKVNCCERAKGVLQASERRVGVRYYGAFGLDWLMSGKFLG